MKAFFASVRKEFLHIFRDKRTILIVMIMPVVFTVMFINFPAGLVLYWLCNNILSIIQQSWTLRNTK